MSILKLILWFLFFLPSICLADLSCQGMAYLTLAAASKGSEQMNAGPSKFIDFDVISSAAWGAYFVGQSTRVPLLPADWDLKDAKTEVLVTLTTLE